MTLKNYTAFNTVTIREIIRFVCPPGVSGYDISIKNSARGYRGRAYSYGTGYHYRLVKGKRKFPPLVIIGIYNGHKWTRPYKWPGGKGYLPVSVFSDVEAVVHLVAHELRHLWQAKVKSGHRVWGARGQFSERDADAYAIRMVRAWRRR